METLSPRHPRTKFPSPEPPPLCGKGKRNWSDRPPPAPAPRAARVSPRATQERLGYKPRTRATGAEGVSASLGYQARRGDHVLPFHVLGRDVEEEILRGAGPLLDADAADPGDGRALAEA